jgi:hypothetical protein
MNNQSTRSLSEIIFKSESRVKTIAEHNAYPGGRYGKIASDLPSPEEQLNLYLRSTAAMMRQCQEKQSPKPTRKPRFDSIEQLVLDVGRNYPAKPLPPSIKLGLKGECYLNAARLAIEMELTYVEGYASSQEVPATVLHAWCLDKEGCVIDPTWPVPGKAYRGIPVKRDYLLSQNKRGVHGILENWQDDFPALQMDPSEWVQS